MASVTLSSASRDGDGSGMVESSSAKSCQVLPRPLSPKPETFPLALTVSEESAEQLR